ncbi:hypothetical protein BXU11_10095 [Flavobacterium sp. LM5]|uniref:hypothetical protein n=1 Tax=Flavobacterium sp. LM5 TaxID=1938610 RepID=UPI0009930EF1|nr:hypothetical protein [Flavobacterium sp. LM5]OOV27791.1 hypothetical protein BXU11_10095 [Flavobacterium sp. LM5]
MESNVKSGKEILDDFFENIESIKDVNKDIAKMLADLYKQNKLTDTSIKNELPKLNLKDGN